MHRRLEAYFLPLDVEIERTLQNLRRITGAESRNMANHKEILEEFWRPIIQEEYSV